MLCHMHRGKDRPLSLSMSSSPCSCYPSPGRNRLCSLLSLGGVYVRLRAGVDLAGSSTAEGLPEAKTCSHARAPHWTKLFPSAVWILSG